MRMMAWSLPVCLVWLVPGNDAGPGATDTI
jgi:hypothetical protein